MDARAVARSSPSARPFQPNRHGMGNSAMPFRRCRFGDTDSATLFRRWIS